jgi:hypothetical protein
MTEFGSAPLDTSDMLAVHSVFRRSLASAPDFVASAQGDDERRALMANYYGNLMAFLQVHHEGEEMLVFPLLHERAPGQMALIDEATSQHHEVVAHMDSCTARIGEWESTGDTAGAPLVQALGDLEAALNPHLSQEEAEILPLANAHLAAEEWGKLPGHGMQNFTGDKIWLILGLIRENMTQQQRDDMLAHMPPPPREMWQNMGEDAYNAMIAQVRQTT